MRPAAPRIESLQVDEVGHDQILVSWEVPEGQPAVQPALCERLAITESVEELELRGFAVRWAPWTSWTRLNWKEPDFREVEALVVERAVDEDADGLVGSFCRRAQFAIRDLEPEQLYVAEIRAHSSCGPGEWRRISEQPICTAIVADAPPAPELVYATPRALTFSFAGVQDDKVVAYEVRRYEGRTGGWRQPSAPQRFDARSLAVRVTSEQRWVVSLDRLRSERTYVLQLRGITREGGVTRWSHRSEAMRTLAPTGESEPDDFIGVGTQTLMEGDGNAVSSTAPPGSSSDGAESIEDFSKKLESVISFTMDYATGGIALPTVRIPSVAERAEQVLRECQGDREQAMEYIVKSEEDDVSWRTKLPDFLIQQVPVVGCSTLLLRELWRNIRRCALIAHLYGHDTRSSDTQALILTCLVPAGQNGGGGESGGSPQVAMEDVVGSGRRVAVLVSRALAKETLVRATGLKSAGKVLGLLDVAGNLLRNYSSRDTNEVASVAEVVGTNATDTDSDAAADLARRRRLRADSFDGNVSAAAIEDNVQPSPQRVALIVFRPLSWQERPIVVLLLMALWFLPIFVSVIRFVAAKLVPFMAKRVHMEIPVAGAVALVIVTQVVGFGGAFWVQHNMERIVRVPATLIFVVYSAIPGTSICLATRSILQGATEAPFFVVLGICNLGSGYLRWAEDVSDDAALEQRPEPKASRYRGNVRKARRVLFVGLLLDFAVEEVLGRLCGLHSLRLLGGKDSKSLAEYRTLAWAVGLLAAWCQGHALELLQRRTVLLRMLGARKAIYAGLSLLLMGAFAVVKQSQTLTFLRESSPTPRWCCAVLWTRSFGAGVGILIPLVLHTLQHPGLLGGLSTDVLVPVTLIVGLLLGYFVCKTYHDLWWEKREDLESDYRILTLFPHMSMQARGKARTAMRLAFKKGISATHDTAVTWATSRMARSAFNYVAAWAAYGRTSSTGAGTAVGALT